MNTIQHVDEFVEADSPAWVWLYTGSVFLTRDELMALDGFDGAVQIGPGL